MNELIHISESFMDVVLSPLVRETDLIFQLLRKEVQDVEICDTTKSAVIGCYAASKYSSPFVKLVMWSILYDYLSKVSQSALV